MDAKGEVDDDASASGAFVDAFGASASTPPGSDLHALLVAAIQQLRDAEQIQGFLARVEQRLGVSQRDRVKWQWLLSELRSIEEMDPLRFDSYVSAAITRLERRMDDLAEDPEPVTRGDQATSTGDAGDAATATSWEALSRVLRDGRSTVLRRLVSAGSIGSAADRDSVGSTGETESQMGHRRQAANSIGIPLLQRTSSTASDAMPRLLRSISSMIGISMEETFLCQICFENVAVADAVQLSACGHRFCYPCIKTYLEIKIADGQVYPVCFHEADELSTIGDDVDALRPNERRKACGTAISQSDIELLVFPDVWKKYVMFRFNKENEYGRQCPFCGESQLCTGPEHPECECVACGKQFCFVHGNAHTDGSCADYELRQAEAEKLNRSAIAEISKPCPGCKANVEKSGGCNHMKCVVCNTDFCWICGAIVESHATPTHFQWWNLRGCAGQQMDDVDAQTPTERFWMSVFRVIFFIVLGPPALIITIALTLTSCCCLPCVFGLEMSLRDLFSMCLNFVAMGLFMILVGLGIAIAFICWLLFEIVALPIRVIYTKCRSCCWRAMPIQRTAGQQSNKSRDLKIDVETSVAVDTA